jgi:KilA-N domain
MTNPFNRFVLKEYDGKQIRINKVTQYVCVTELCLANDKQFYDWYRLKNTPAFLEAVSTETGIPVSDLLIVGKGETLTWAHPQVAIDIGSWCSVEMRVKITGWILELLRTGKVELDPLDDNDRILNMATSAASRSVSRLDPEPRDKINLSGWYTLTEFLELLGEGIEEESSLARDLQFRFWLNRQVADLYRSKNSEEPPQISRKKKKAYCYPPSYKQLVATYIEQWNEVKFEPVIAA